MQAPAARKYYMTVILGPLHLPSLNHSVLHSGRTPPTDSETGPTEARGETDPEKEALLSQGTEVHRASEITSEEGVNPSHENRR
jgi:hypothetical protein